MSGGQGYAPGYGQGYRQGYRGPRASALPVVAAVVLLAAAGLAVGGTFGALYHRRMGSGSITSSATRTGWATIFVTGSESGQQQGSVPVGIPVVVGAALAVVAALVLVLTRRSVAGPGPGRLVGMMAAGLLTGAVAVLWIEVAATAVGVAESLVTNPEYEQTFEIGDGAWLFLSAAVLAVVASGLLLVSPRPPAYPPPPWPPPWQPPPPPWPAAPPWNGPPRA